MIKVWTQKFPSNNAHDVILTSQMAISEVVKNVGNVINVIYGKTIGKM